MEPKNLLSAIIGRKVRVCSGKKYTVGIEGVVTAVNHSGYNIMITFKTENCGALVSVDYNLELA